MRVIVVVRRLFRLRLSYLMMKMITLEGVLRIHMFVVNRSNDSMLMNVNWLVIMFDFILVIMGC